MSAGCCAKPVARIIKVGDNEVGLIGLDETFRIVYGLGVQDEELLKEELLAWIKKFGNYVPPSRESVYHEALLREYRRCAANASAGGDRQNR
jgi:hypothetical protein